MPTLRDMPAEGIALIKAFEGIPDGDPSTVNLDPYLDPLAIWTIGWGHAVLSAGKMVRGAENRALARAQFPGGITMAQAEALLRGDLVSRAGDVLRLVRVALNDNQFAALMSFVFNCGAANLALSTLLKRLNEGNLAAAADQFLVWNKGKKNGVLVELPGLTRRRKAERALFLGQDWRAAAGVPAATRGGPPAAGARARRKPGPEAPVRPGRRAEAAMDAPHAKQAAAKAAAKKPGRAQAKTAKTARTPRAPKANKVPKGRK